MIQIELMSKAQSVINKSYSPYSHFCVGAAILTDKEEIFTGVNIENVSYSLTMCAERVAIFKALSEGHRIFTDLAIATSSNSPIFPCGACRQVLFEFNPRIKIHVEGNEQKYFILEDLLPHTFDSRHN